jgi:hypothetical protein
MEATKPKAIKRQIFKLYGVIALLYQNCMKKIEFDYLCAILTPLESEVRGHTTKLHH